MPVPAAKASSAPLANWAGNIIYRAGRIEHPRIAADVAKIVRASAHVSALGTRHAFSHIGDTRGTLIATDRLNKILRVDKRGLTVAVGPGVTYAALGRFLYARGLAVENTASLPHICAAGAVATGTHGSGQTGSLSTSVVALKLVDGRGAMVAIDANSPGGLLNGSVVSLGLLGIVVELTLRVRPAFAIVQRIHRNVPLEMLCRNFNAVTRSAYSVSFFTDWQGECVNQVWFKHDVTKHPAPAPPFAFLGPHALRTLHPIESIPADNCTPHVRPGPSHLRLPHFRPDRLPSAEGPELQSEFFVAREDAPAALRAVAKLGRLVADHLLISEVRTIAADRLWLSPAYGRDSVSIHFTWRPHGPAVHRLIGRIEAALAPFHFRVHWGKLFRVAPKVLRSRYPRFAAFQRLRQRFDPEGKFLTDCAKRWIL